MYAADLWSLFLETGSPEVYLLYTRQLKMEEGHVSDDSGHRPEGHGLQ